MTKTACLIAYSIVLSLTSSGQLLKGDIIVWNSKTMLHWNNFKGTPDSSSKYQAMSFISFEYQSRLEKDTLMLIITCCFFTNSSWVKPQSKNKLLLMHEQTHFDIYEYCRRIFVQKLLNADLKKATVFNQIRITGFGIEMMLDKMNNEYDEQTQFSMNRSKQKKWSAAMEARLNQLQASSQMELKLPLSD